MAERAKGSGTIVTVLWRCPLCAINDALVHRQRFLRPDLLDCGQCGAAWQIRRVPGDNFYLKLTHPSRSTDHVAVGREFALPAWYDAMKATLRLTPIHDPAAPLESGEILFLASGLLDMEVEATDALFFPAQPAESLKIQKSQVKSKAVGPGRMFLTDRRLIWVEQDGRVVSLRLSEINTAYIMFHLILMVEMRLYMLFFGDESPLKWLTYLSTVIERYHPDIHRTIKFSHF